MKVKSIKGEDPEVDSILVKIGQSSSEAEDNNDLNYISWDWSLQLQMFQVFTNFREKGNPVLSLGTWRTQNVFMSRQSSGRSLPLFCTSPSSQLISGRIRLGYNLEEEYIPAILLLGAE